MKSARYISKLLKYRLFGSMALIRILTGFLLSLPVWAILFLLLRNPPTDRIKAFPVRASNHTEDNLQEGLIARGFDKASCLSRYESNLYRKISPHQPSSYLLSRLRSYEDLHRKCGPHTKSYITAMSQLINSSDAQEGKTSVDGDSEECKYVVWISYSGLGNKILTITSAFLYALLTNRVLLLDPGKDMGDLFCEPFPQNVSWLLSNDFPFKDRFGVFDKNYPHSHGKILKHRNDNSSILKWPECSVPRTFLYIHLAYDCDDYDKLFYLEEDEEQTLIRKAPWLLLRTDSYFVPSLFLMPSFQQELEKLFPDEKKVVFHHLGRYLFHPSNHVWELITRYYQAHLAKADERIGIQVRTFELDPGPFPHVMEQIYACVFKQKLLPQVVDKQNPKPISSKNPKLKSVLITSLTSGYYKNVSNMYWKNPTVTGDLMEILQPSNEGVQKTDNNSHDRKALAEMYLLSLCDVLVTSAWSTFGYVAQGLGDLKPWMMYRPVNQTVPDPPCGRVWPIEPCFHSPPNYDIKAKGWRNLGGIVPHVRWCEDVSWGLKLVS